MTSPSGAPRAIPSAEPEMDSATTRETPVRSGIDDAVMIGIIGTAPPEAALRAGFREAEHRGAPVRVMAVGPAPSAEDEFIRGLVERWAEKYPLIPVTITVRREIDAVVTLVAATRRCAVAFVQGTSDVAASAVTQALSHRAHCAVSVVDG